jgi:hypothetical protein
MSAHNGAAGNEMMTIATAAAWKYNNQIDTEEEKGL